MQRNYILSVWSCCSVISGILSHIDYTHIYRPTLHNKLCNWYSEYTHAKSNNERELIGLWSKVLSLLAMIYIAKWFCSNDGIYLLEQYPREWLKNEDLLQILPCQVGLQWKAKVCEFWWTRMSYWPQTPYEINNHFTLLHCIYKFSIWYASVKFYKSCLRVSTLIHSSLTS